jgi:hypothetical protein
MPLKLNSTSGGSVTLQEPTTASNRTLTLPDATGTVNTSGAVNEVPAGSASAPSIYPTGDTNTGMFFPAADTIAFAEGGVESARIDSSGNLLIARTDVVNQGRISVNMLGGTNVGLSVVNTNGSNTGNFCNFARSDTAVIGAIQQNGASAVTYSTSSDYRLKENIEPMTGALAKVAQLKPCTYAWKIDGSTGEGFIAHELQAVVPDCVTGEKDAVDADGNPVYQGIDTSFLVATLTAAIQELKAEVDSLRAQVEAK